jgi:hypothetical protein
MMTKAIALAGMFNMNNFGDLLFPVVADHMLAPLGFSVVPVASTAEEPAILNALRPIGLDDFERSIDHFSGLVIGGGHMIHTQQIEHFIDSRERMPSWTGSGLWLGSSFLAARKNLPILWNAPGVPHPLPQSRHKLANLAMQTANYCSVRDKGSANMLLQTGSGQIEIVPDTIGLIDEVWPRESLTADFRAFCRRTGLSGDERLVSVHARDRSLPNGDAESLAKAVSDLALELDFVPVLHGLGQAHKDDETAQKLSRNMSCQHIVYDQPKALREVVSLLANSAAYIGSSLHGYIVAEAYGQPAVLIGKPAYKKFAGYLDHSKQYENLFADWETGLAGLTLRLGQSRQEGKGDGGHRNHEALKRAIKQHFSCIATRLTQHDLEEKSIPQRDFLACYEENLQSANATNWLYSPNY